MNPKQINFTEVIIIGGTSTLNKNLFEVIELLNDNSGGGGGGGTVESISIDNANGFSGVVTGTTDLDVELSVTIDGLLKGNSGALEEAIAGTDYVEPSALANYILKAGDSVNGDLTFANALGIDATVATEVLNIGVTNAGVINIGNSNTEVNIFGTRNWITVTDLEITDKLIRLNKNGPDGSGFGSGFEIEENNIVTGYFKTNFDASMWRMRVPATQYDFILNHKNITDDRIWTVPDASGTFVGEDTYQTLTNKVYSNPRLNTTSTIGHVWTATDNAGNGAWVAPSGGGGGSPGGSAGQIQYNNSGAFGGLNMALFDGTDLIFDHDNFFLTDNVSSPTKLLSFSITGITGTKVWGFPNANDTFVGIGASQTLTNKTLTSPIINVGSDATGDIYYRNSGGAFTRLAAGTNGHVLTLASGLPSWVAPSGGTATMDILMIQVFS